MRAIASRAWSWPRTSASRAPQSTSPGSYTLICLIPAYASGPRKMSVLARKMIGMLIARPIQVVDESGAANWSRMRRGMARNASATSTSPRSTCTRRMTATATR